MGRANYPGGHGRPISVLKHASRALNLALFAAIFAAYKFWHFAYVITGNRLDIGVWFSSDGQTRQALILELFSRVQQSQ